MSDNPERGTKEIDRDIPYGGSVTRTLEVQSFLFGHSGRTLRQQLSFKISSEVS
jgi:hypothetical protein